MIRKPDEPARGQIALIQMGLSCGRQVSNHFGHVSVTWKEPRAEQPGACWAWPLPPIPTIPSPLWASGGTWIPKRPRERHQLSLQEKQIWPAGRVALLVACRADISTHQPAGWLLSLNALRESSWKAMAGRTSSRGF